MISVASLLMEAESTSEMTVSFYQTTRYLSRRRKNLNSDFS
jgi:hypothetical protein